MRTIDNIIPYRLSKEQVQKLKENKVINWVGSEWWFKFEIIKEKIEQLPFIDLYKIESLYNDIDTLSRYHDIEYTKGASLFWFLRANYDFSLWLITLLNWTSKSAKIGIFFSTFIWLSIFGRKSYNWKDKKTLMDLLK